jgi:Ca2+-transporting ATPase
LRDIDVVARARPAQKLLLVQALKNAHEIVAVTGDGVNDVPALQAADIGFAMGERGTRSAREAASIVLLNDNFRTIVSAIGEGRQLFRNLRLSFHYLLVVHIPLVLTAALIPLAGYPLLYLPTHIVWLEMIIHPTAMLAFQSLAPKELVPPKSMRAGTQFFLGAEWAHIALSGLIATGVVAAGFLHALYDSGGIESGRAMAMASQVATSSIVAAAVSRLRTRAAVVVCGVTLAFSIILIQVPALSHLLHLRPLRLEQWALAVVGGSIAASISWRGTSGRKY